MAGSFETLFIILRTPSLCKEREYFTKGDERTVNITDAATVVVFAAAASDIVIIVVIVAPPEFTGQ